MNGASRVTAAATGATDLAIPLSGAALRREQSRREMRVAILDEARRLLTNEGASALSMRAIARALGYSPAALYEYFERKEDILVALYFEGADGLAGHMGAVRASMMPGDSVDVMLPRMGRAYRAYAQGNPELFRLVFGGAARDEQHHLEDDGERPGFDELVAVIEQGVASGEIDFPAAEPLAVACWSMVHGFVVLEIAGFLKADKDPGPNGLPEGQDRIPRFGRPDADALFDLVLDRCLHGVLARTGER